jgi:hypothetical protein
MWSVVDRNVQRDLVQQFEALSALEGADCWLLHDSATCRTAYETANMLKDLRGDCLITINIWLPCSLDLSRPDFFFVGSLEGKNL